MARPPFPPCTLETALLKVQAAEDAFRRPHRAATAVIHSTGGATMLEMRTSCERCGRPLRADAVASICVHECTFCPACTEALDGTCPNCSGELVRRPRAGVRA